MQLQDLAQMGTRRYMSPEILEGSVNLTNPGYLLEGDIYAMALLLWEISMRCSDFFEGKLIYYIGSIDLCTTFIFFGSVIFFLFIS